jgi:predicted RNase H-like nuclease
LAPPAPNPIAAGRYLAEVFPHAAARADHAHQELPEAVIELGDVG